MRAAHHGLEAVLRRVPRGPPEAKNLYICASMYSKCASHLLLLPNCRRESDWLRMSCKEQRNKRRQMVHLVTTLIETIFSSIFASLWRLISSSDREKRQKFELNSLKKEEIHNEIRPEIVENITKKAPFFSRLRRKQTLLFSPTAKTDPISVFAFGEFRPEYFFPPAAKNGAGVYTCSACHTISFWVVCRAEF